MRTCVWCDSPLPEPQQKGHRRREFCNNACKLRHHRWYKKMQHDAGMIADPYWKVAYGVLVEQYKLLEQQLQDCMNDLTEMQERVDIFEARIDTLKELRRLDETVFQNKLEDKDVEITRLQSLLDQMSKRRR